MRSFDEIQAAYVEEMRALQPELLKWWCALADISDPNQPAPRDVSLRWPTGISGHPRAIEVFRRYFLEIEAANDVAFNAVAGAPTGVPQVAWGTEGAHPRAQMRRAADILIADIEFIAPDLAKFAEGIVFVPVGLNQHDEPV